MVRERYLPLLRATYGSALLMLLIGLAATVAAAAKQVRSNSFGIPVMVVGVLAGSAIVWFGFRIVSTQRFLWFVTLSWLASRSLLVWLFPHFVLCGDEGYFHHFVARLPLAMANRSLPALSDIYDFPVWLSRSFPFYLPLAAIFGSQDLWAARILNVLLGAAQLIILFFITRRLLGTRGARLACLLMLIFPYHWINVLSYDPQIAGTFFLLLAVCLFLYLNSPRLYSNATLAGMGVCLALSLLFAGIQRGGIDLLLVAVILIVLLVQRKIHPKHRVVCLVAICLLWLPLRSAFGHWVEAQDANLLRSHTLGFMTRGWNLEVPGEYLGLYEQLDVTAAATEKQRTLEAVLVTEFARQPIRSLLLLPPVKIAKFFALGYASTAEQGLAAGGYSSAAFIYQCLRSIYAPIILALCLWGLFRCWRSPALQRRLLVPVLLTVLSCAAIVLIWETSPRYSHPIQFALMIVAAAGMLGSPKTWAAARIRPRLIARIGGSAMAIIGCWLVVSFCIAAAAKSATRYHFIDPRGIRIELSGRPSAIEPIHGFSQSWEGAIDIPARTALPAELDVLFPPPLASNWDHLSVSIWQPDVDASPYAVTCIVGDRRFTVPAAKSGHMLRIEVPKAGIETGGVRLAIAANQGVARISSGFRIGVGYALVN